MIAGSGRCFYHPERSGIGICVECRNVICTECTTQFEGINRCAKCLALKLAAAKALIERNDWSVGAIFLALVSVAFLFGIVLGLATIFTPSGSTP
jgi:hypothetical protein